jgi:NADPH:quinone reductase
MKAIICDQYGPIGNLKYQDVESPEPRAGEIVIRSEAIGVNYPDGLLVQGLYQTKPDLPFIPGMEVAGEIVRVGEGVTRFAAGDRVVALVNRGAFAEEVKADQALAMPLAANADAAAATALICGYGTAHHALKQRAGLREGEILAVTGAAGLTGLAAVQIGKAMGAEVIAVASTAEKLAVAIENGADQAIGYENLRDELRTVSRGQGVDVVFEVVGGPAFEACARAMAWKGRLLVIGFAGGEIPKFPVNLALVKGFSVVGVFWGAFTQKEPQIYAENMAQLLEWQAEGKVRPYVEAKYPLSRAAEALTFIHERKAIGKIVLEPGG